MKNQNLSSFLKTSLFLLKHENPIIRCQNLDLEIFCMYLKRAQWTSNLFRNNKIVFPTLELKLDRKKAVHKISFKLPPTCRKFASLKKAFFVVFFMK